MRANEALVIEPAKSWQRLQQANEFFVQDLDQQLKEHHRQFLEALMCYERQCFLNAQPYQRSPQRVDQANGFYQHSLTTRLGVLSLAVPRTRSGRFRSQVLPRYQRREPKINEALKQVFLLGVATRQAGRALATLIGEAVSAATVSAVAKALDSSVLAFHRRPITDQYRYLVLDAVSVRIRLVGKVQRRQVLCAYGISATGRRQLIDFQIVKEEAQDTWFDFLWGLWARGLRAQALEQIVTNGHAGLVKAIGRLWPTVRHQRCWAHKLRNLDNKLKASQRSCLRAIPGFLKWTLRTSFSHSFLPMRPRGTMRGASQPV